MYKTIFNYVSIVYSLGMLANSSVTVERVQNSDIGRLELEIKNVNIFRYSRFGN